MRVIKTARHPVDSLICTTHPNGLSSHSKVFHYDTRDHYRHSGLALQSLRRESLIRLDHIFDVDAMVWDVRQHRNFPHYSLQLLFYLRFDLLHELGAFPNLKAVQLDLTSYDPHCYHLRKSTLSRWYCLATSLPIINGHRYVEGIRSTSGRWACMLYRKNDHSNTVARPWSAT